MSAYLPPLQIHVVSDGGLPQGGPWSDQLQQWFSGNRDVYAVPEPNIPVLVWRGSEANLPPDIEWSSAKRTALLLLIDEKMAGSEAWGDWTARQDANKRPGDVLVPVALTADFTQMGGACSRTNAIRLDRIAAADQEGFLLLLATHSLARWYLEAEKGQRRVRLFISHAKAKSGSVSGRELAQHLKDFVDKHPIGGRFFDEVDISAGEDFEQILEEAIRESVVVVLLTDAFSSRFWCGWEVTTAKELHRPVIVVDLLEHGEPVSLAYVGKTPTIRWSAVTEALQKDPVTHRRIIAGALLEQFRLTHDEARLKQIQELALRHEPRVHVSARPPELATLPERDAAGGTTLVLHTDPPLPRYELKLIQRQRPDLTLASATQALAGYHAGLALLRGRRVAISISDSPDREAQGMTKNAQERLWTQLATHLILAGAELAYGGDLRSGGYTEQLIDLARSSADAGRPLPERILHWYAGWPTSAKLTDKDKARLPRTFRLHASDLPAGVPGDKSWPPGDMVPEHHFAWTLGTGEMRRQMARDCHARILVGGPFLSVSPWPGLLEEFETFVGKPIYLLGGFGGVTRVLIEALQGGNPRELSEAFQDEGGRRTGIRLHYDAQARAGTVPGLSPIDWTARVEALHRVGIGGLKNGLSDDENRRLFVTRSLTEMIALVLEGLRRVASGTGTGP